MYLRITATEEAISNDRTINMCIYYSTITIDIVRGGMCIIAFINNVITFERGPGTVRPYLIEYINPNVLNER